MSPYSGKSVVRADAGPSWNLRSVVSDLRELRNKDREARHAPARLPSRKALVRIMDGFAAALFPSRLSHSEITEGGIDFFVGHTLDLALTALARQVHLEFELTHGRDAPLDHDDLAGAVARGLARELPSVRALLDTDVRAAFAGDPAAHNLDEVLICYPGVTAMIHHRIAHVLYGLKAPLIARMIAEIAHSSTGIDIHPGAQIEESFFIDHGTGVVIGETTIIGKRVRLYQAVTLGAKRFAVDEEGALVKGGARHPIVEDDVVIYAGATILGRVTIGRGSSIGGNVWLTRSVPPNSSISQASVRSESFHDGGGI